MREKVKAKDIPRPVVNFGDKLAQKDIFNRVVNLAADLGVQIVCDKDAPVDSGCPFSSVIKGIKWGRSKPDKVILNKNDFDLDHVSCKFISILAGEIIHELGHIISRSTKKSEIDFFGWEFVIASRYDLTDGWLLSSSSYSIDDYGQEFGGLDMDEQSDILEESVILSTNKGFIANGVPKGLSE